MAYMPPEERFDFVSNEARRAAILWRKLLSIGGNEAKKMMSEIEDIIEELRKHIIFLDEEWGQ